MKFIQNYQYCVDNYGTLDIYITDMQGNQFLTATVQDCANKSAVKLELLAQEILEEQGYVLAQKE